ncbi:a159 [Rat cytomegalovirus ALL-03]|uniref:A159 n=2 Tax=Rat cytomegalovirus (isolate England) TaxID=1261657 RepID=A0A0F6R6R4_RCMVE|nr:e159 [Murid betaherpesvirus 8]AKE44309.1 a159 [Rat cytomegalovirus ALL-03]AFX83459.1 e159 [Murid betaherpesvirus 8]WEG71932.1 membrane protein e156 [Murid betaherpesvirus 8]WPH25322.1 membrane protein e156 [Murid betaherpesvirus 8]WPH25455.1 membrane protein e156 [Murid betaherpesvirus 8]
MACIRYVTLLVGIFVTFTAGESDKCYYVPHIKIQMTASTNESNTTGSAMNVTTSSGTISVSAQSVTSNGVTTPAVSTASLTSVPSTSTSVAAVSTSTSNSSVSPTSISTLNGSTSVVSTSPMTTSMSATTEDTTEVSTEGPTSTSLPSTTVSPKVCNYTFTWEGFITGKNTTIVYMGMNDTKINFYSHMLDNLTKETEFMKGHFDYMKNLTTNYTKTENCSTVTVLLTYDCCYDPNSRSTCYFVQTVNGNVSISVYFNSSSGGTTFTQSKDTDYWTFFNSSTMCTFWSNMKDISSKWSRFKGYANSINSPLNAYGSTTIYPYNSTHLLVNCSVSAKDLYGVSLSWYSSEDDSTEKYNVSTWAVNVNGTGSGWSSIYVRNETVSNLKCYASSSSLWDSYLPVPYNGPVPLGSEIPFALIFAICLTLVVFILIGCVACCMFVCRRRDSASISAL